MKQDNITQWAFNFFTSVKLMDGAILPIKPSAEYDMRVALISLKHLLQDSGMSRTPFDCKLIHQHYRNPSIHDCSRDQLYIVLEKRTVNGVYAEIYLRDSEYGYKVGYEAIDGDVNNLSTAHHRHSHEVSIFEMSEDSRMYKLAIEYLTPLGPDHLALAKEKYDRQNAAFEEFFKSFNNSKVL